MAAQGANLVLACRSLERGRQAQQEIVEKAGNERVELLQMDLASQASIRKAAGQFLAMHERLDVLIHNAANFDHTLKKASLTEDGVETIFATDYTPSDKAALPSQAAEFSLGCGNPTAFAALQPGEVVVDIGSGGGLDALIAARQVGAQGRVIGVDMTPEMLERARRAAAAAGFDNVEFRQGQAEALPVESSSVDVIISNCVINLTADKGAVFLEARRVLRPGGRLEVSDIVTDRAFLPDMLCAGQAWSSCVTGALPEAEYVDLIRQAGFSQVMVRRSEAALTGGVKVYSAQVSARKLPINDG